MLKLQHVTKTFGSKKALDDLCMEVPQGSVYGLVGPNGAGKSTAIRHALGIYRPDSGEITLDGVPVYENPAAKSRMGNIPDEVFYYPSASLKDMRQFYKSIYKDFDDTLYGRLNEVFQLPQEGAVRRLSKGMQKQAAFQLTLCTHPDILLLDEPVDGLDPVMRRQVWNLLLSDVAQKGATVLVSSHNLRELEDVCDHVGIMAKGKMLMERSLESMQGNTVKLQIVGEVPDGLEVLHALWSGRLNTVIVRGTAEEVAARVQKTNPAYFDVLPLSLEEIFIYELGGVNYEVRDILL